MKKKRTIIFLCIILLLAAAFCLTAFRVRGSVSVKGEGSTQSPDPVFFSQKDPLWAGDLLGDSSFTMETSGCLTACLAAELRMQDISIPEINAMDPGTLNSFFSGKQVYDREGNIQWDPLSSALNVSLERINGISAMRKTDLTALLSEGIDETSGFPILADSNVYGQEMQYLFPFPEGTGQIDSKSSEVHLRSD